MNNPAHCSRLEMYPQAGITPDDAHRQAKQRLHFQHGPIDLIIDIECDNRSALNGAIRHGEARFDTILTELVQELPALRSAVSRHNHFTGAVARRMWAATSRFQNIFVTPMAAVAGAVADEMLNCMLKDKGIRRLSINNGGDIALWAIPDEDFRIGVIPNVIDGFAQTLVPAVAEITATSGINGVATSGWRGRSYSLGIADSVTVFAENAAAADVAATLIANATQLESNKVDRQPACELDADSDLGEMLVTTDVQPLDESEIKQALCRGIKAAQPMHSVSLISAAVIFLQGHHQTVGDFTALSAEVNQHALNLASDPVLL